MALSLHAAYRMPRPCIYEALTSSHTNIIFSHTHTPQSNRDVNKTRCTRAFARPSRFDACQSAKQRTEKKAKEILLKPVDLIIITKGNNDDGSLFSVHCWAWSASSFFCFFFLLLICILTRRRGRITCPLT